MTRGSPVATTQLQITSYKFFSYSLQRHIERLRQHSCLSDDAHKIGVGHPSRQDVHVDVACYSGSRGFPDIHAQIDAIWHVERAQHRLHSLRESHHLVGRISGKLLQLIEVRIRDDHYVAVGVGIGIEDHVTVGAAMDDSGLFVAELRRIAKNAARYQIGAGNERVAPGSPQVIHGGRVAEKRLEPRATGCEPRTAGNGGSRQKLVARSILAIFTSRTRILFDTPPKRLL